MKNAVKALIVFMLIALVVGCSAAEEVPEVPIYEGGLSSGPWDMDGLVIKAMRDNKSAADTYLGYIVDTSLADDALKRVTEVEALYNCKIEFNSDTNFNDQLMFSSAAGAYYVDFAVFPWYFTDFTPSGYLLPMSDLTKYIDYTDTEKWGGKNMLEELVWKGQLYGVVPVTWPEYYLTLVDFVIATNTNMIMTMGHPDPREYVEKGEWTRDMFAECVNTYYTYNGDGNTIYGLSLYRPHFYDMSLRASGVEIVINKNGKWVSGIHTDTGREALEWASNFLNVSCASAIDKEHNETQAALVSFCDEHSATVLMHSNYVFSSNSQYDSKVSYKIDDFGILPFPLGPEVEYGQWIGQYERTNNVLCFPMTAENPEAAATVANTIFEPLDSCKTSEEVKEYYLRNIFHDERDYNVMMKMIENCRYNFYNQGLRQIADEAAKTSDVSITELLSKYEASYQAIIDEKVAPIYDYIDSVWN